MTSSHHAPYVLGYTRATLADTKGCKPARVSESQKVGLGSDWRLKLAFMKAAGLLIADQPAHVNMFPALVPTARPTTKVANPLSPCPPPQGRTSSKVGSTIGVKS